MVWRASGESIEGMRSDTATARLAAGASRAAGVRGTSPSTASA